MSMGVLQSDKDLEEACNVLASGGAVRPELRDRLDREVEQIREEIRRKHGILNIAVELIHETRERA